MCSWCVMQNNKRHLLPMLIKVSANVVKLIQGYIGIINYMVGEKTITIIHDFV